MLRINLPYPPSANRMWRSCRGKIYLSDAAKTWKRSVGWIARTERAQKLEGPVAVAIWLYPKLTKKGKPSKTRLDLDNAIKITLDALNGIAWDDDRQVVALCANIAEARNGGGLGVLVHEFSGLAPRS